MTYKRFSSQYRSRSRPARLARPVTGYVGKFPGSKTLKPVARISTSTSWTVPLWVTTPSAVIWAIGSVSGRTSSRLYVARYSFVEARALAAHRVDRGALKDGELLRLRSNGGDHLDRRCASPDDGDALSAQILRRVPARGVDGGAGKRLDTVDVRGLGDGQHAGRVDDVPCVQAVATIGLESPDVAALIEGRSGDPGPEPDLVPQAVARRALLGVVEQLRARGVHA